VLPSQRADEVILLGSCENHTWLWLKIFNAQVRCQNISRQLLLQLFLDLLPESLVNLQIFRIKLGQDDELKAPDDPLFC